MMRYREHVAGFLARLRNKTHPNDDEDITIISQSRRALPKAFGSVTRLRKAAPGQIERVPGIGRTWRSRWWLCSGQRRDRRGMARVKWGVLWLRRLEKQRKIRAPFSGPRLNDRRGT